MDVLTASDLGNGGGYAIIRDARIPEFSS